MESYIQYVTMFFSEEPLSPPQGHSDSFHHNGDQWGQGAHALPKISPTWFVFKYICRSNSVSRSVLLHNEPEKKLLIQRTMLTNETFWSMSLYLRWPTANLGAGRRAGSSISAALIRLILADCLYLTWWCVTFACLNQLPQDGFNTIRFQRDDLEEHRTAFT